MNGDRARQPDIAKAMSMAEAAAKDMAFVLSLPVTEAAGPTIVRGVYENFRLLGDALLVAKGIQTVEHTEMIGALMQLRVKTSRPLRVLDNLRKLRHDVNYRGYRPTLDEIEDAIAIAKSLFEPLKRVVLVQIKSLGV